MKTAEEWYKEEYWNLSDLTSNDLVPIFKQIQLDAWKQGMTDAAAIIMQGHESDFQRSVIGIEIEYARNNKTTL